MSTPLLWNLRPSETGRQIVMFPFLGGFGASYNRLVKELSGDWDVWTVNPPGHGPSTEPPYRRLVSLVDRYLTALRDVLRPDAVFFGHSMGGVVAYHVMLAMAARPSFEGRRPTDLVLSACRGPRRLQIAGNATLPERELLERLLAFGAIPAEVAEDRSLIDLFLPAFRADYQVLEDARRMPVATLDVRARLVLGSNDPQAPASSSAEWQEHLAEPIRTHVLDGEEHMFVLSATGKLDRIFAELRDAAMPRS
ncbi:thioesterase II family protein [Glycomyces sp. NRRL B-16210]|uniref:thioesterase II family protein n=1 Tax=Glycomyces sp. NRRL B-16210 TaxID=1463821 RepID=UPI000A40073D|nr:alpha/beta fold hydrolase [Glycomyces sp. NRRL B-16210]